MALWTGLKNLFCNSDFCGGAVTAATQQQRSLFTCIFLSGAVTAATQQRSLVPGRQSDIEGEGSTSPEIVRTTTKPAASSEQGKTEADLGNIEALVPQTASTQHMRIYARPSPRPDVHPNRSGLGPASTWHTNLQHASLLKTSKTNGLFLSARPQSRKSRPSPRP